MPPETEAERKEARRENRRRFWRAVKRAGPALVRAIAACSDELVAALADGRVTPTEALAIGLAFAEALADESGGDE